MIRHHALTNRQSVCFFAAALLTALSACGELNNDDLIFVNGTPRSEELRIDVDAPASTTSALTTQADPVDDPTGGIGQPAQFYDLLATGSAETNGQVDSLLEFIDSIGRGYEPTTRSRTSRVWGPYENFDRRGFTLRYEVSRTETGFRYCLHIGRDSEVTGEPTCDDVPNGKGMRAIIYGTYVPSTDGAGVRMSDGEVTLDFESSYGLGFGEPKDRGALHIDHLYADAGATKEIIIDARTPRDGSDDETLHYSYAHDTRGRVSYGLQGMFDAVDRTRTLEEMSITSCWYDDGAGRAEVALARGDLAAISTATFVECWDLPRNRTYVSATFPDAPILNGVAGNAATCPPIDCP